MLDIYCAQHTQCSLTLVYLEFVWSLMISTRIEIFSDHILGSYRAQYILSYVHDLAYVEKLGHSDDCLTLPCK